MADTIFMDNAAGTRLLDEVFEEMKPFFLEQYGNPSSIHPLGASARSAVDDAREKVAALIGAEPKEIYFTSTGSEANNLAIKGAAWANKKKGSHIVVSGIDHQSVLYAARALSRLGWEVTTVDVDSEGFVYPDEVLGAIRDDTIVVSVTHASNEIGTIQSITEIAAKVKEKGVSFHTDAIQMAGVMPVNVKELGVDMLSLAGNAFYGPKGAAALYIREGVRVFSLIEGGIQERGRRAGTENVSAIVGLGKAAELATRDMESRIAATVPLRNQLMQGLEDAIPKLYVNGDRDKRLPGNVHVSIEAVEGESMLFMLAGKGIMTASGSSCADKALKSSHVLQAIGCDPALANASVLFSLGFENTKAEVDKVLAEFPPIIEKLRSYSPLWKG